MRDWFDVDEEPILLVVYADIPRPGIRVLGLRGELGVLTAPDVEQILDGQLAAAPKAIILDLAELGFLGPAGISVLTCAAFRAWLNDIGFCVAGARRAVARALRASGLVELFDLHDTVEDAVVTYG